MIAMRSSGPLRPLAFVLDDEIAVGTMVCNQLMINGMEAWQFSDPHKFLKEFRVSRPKLIVLDLALGKSDAIEVIRKLEVMRFTGRILLISGRDKRTLDEIENIGRSHGLHMLQSLQKPFRAADLKNRLLAATRPVLGENLTAASPAGERPSIELADALREGWLEVWYQPKINLQSLSICGAEALIRARHPEHGMIAPADLLPPPGDPLYRPLSAFVLRRAMEDWAFFAERGLPLKLAINVPASVLNTPEFVDVFRQTVPSGHSFPGLFIEVTEDEVIADWKGVSEAMAQLKLYNASISIDDFGTAHSSLSRVKNFPFSEIKLDRSFVASCANDPIKRGICHTVVDLAHRFNASACAEGVETIDDLRCLVGLGFDTAQGFLFAKPMSRSDFCGLVLSRKLEPESSATSQQGAKTEVHSAWLSTL
ncbi:EAL domain-containing protein (putative c-di-GMP-specific phosphodiesterase class I)/ActR/RegA family two-component response regulator [Nitrobacteraceae bacterium AZCC 2161]